MQKKKNHTHLHMHMHKDAHTQGADLWIDARKDDWELDYAFILVVGINLLA